MKIMIIWTVAAVICLVPIGWLALRNPRAVPIGAFIMALLVFVPLGMWGIGNAGDPSARPMESFRMFVIAIAVTVGLVVLNAWLLQGSRAQRIGSTLVSMGVWAFVFTVLYLASGQVGEAKTEALNEEYAAPIRAANAEAAVRRQILDAAPSGRRAVLDRTLVELEAEAAKSYETLERFLVFGDPAVDPGHVVVWGVLTTRPESPWEDFGFFGERLHYRLNDVLRLRGYPAQIALGFAPTADVDRAGGDRAYFGPDGKRWVPQYPPDNQIGAAPRALDVPRRSQ